jgi:hypothetical protein
LRCSTITSTATTAHTTATPVPISGSSPGWFKDDIPNWDSPDLRVRCDNRVAGSAGCVFDKYIPTYTVNTKKYPVAGALYWTAMQRLSSHPVGKPHNSPLHRGFEDVDASTNRAWMCGAQSGDPGGFKAHPDSFLGSLDPDEQPECDEYAFAAAQESAGSNKVPVTGAPRARTRGIDCAQFYATRKTGKWQLLPDLRGALQTWNEPCVRGAIPGNQNEAAGGGVGGIVSKYRLQYGDPYYVETPGFDGCSPTAPACEINIL